MPKLLQESAKQFVLDFRKHDRRKNLCAEGESIIPVSVPVPLASGAFPRARRPTSPWVEYDLAKPCSWRRWQYVS